jgi:hypothetical protein
MLVDHTNVFRASRTDSLLTPVDDFRHPFPTPLAAYPPTPTPDARHPWIEKGLLPMPWGDARDGMGIAPKLQCLRLDSPVRWAGMGRCAKPA